jgi:hypothetical protein
VPLGDSGTIAAMDIDELDRAEQLALGGLIRLLVRSDGDFTQAEEDRINGIGERIGGSEVIWRLISTSAQAYPHDGQIRVAASAVERPEARALFLDVLGEVAEPDGVAAEETALIDWLRGAWAGD